MLHWFRRLMPREEQFFDMSSGMPIRSCMVRWNCGHARRRRRGRDALPAASWPEDEADGITREVLIAVRRTFITPFDRGDIKDLITAMDDTIDQMQKTAKAIVLFEMTDFEPRCARWPTTIVDCAQLVARGGAAAAHINPNAASINEICEQIAASRARRRDARSRAQGALPARQAPATRWRSSRRRDL